MARKHKAPGDPEESSGSSCDFSDEKRTQFIHRIFQVHHHADEAISRDSSEYSFRQSMRVGKSCVFEWREKTDDVLQQKECLSLFGVKGGDIHRETTKDFLKRVHPEDREHFVSAVNSLSPARNTYTITFRMIRDDHLVEYREETAQGFFDREGCLERVIGITTDVTKQEKSVHLLRLAHSELEKTAAQTQAILDNMTEALTITDSSGEIIYHNPAALTLYGYENAETTHISFESMVKNWVIRDECGSLLGIEEWPIQKALHGERFADFRAHIKNTQTGKEFTGSFGGAPVFTKEGDLLCAIITARDITHEIQAGLKLNKINQTLEDMVRERTADLENSVQQLAKEMERRSMAEQALHERSQILEAFFEHTITPLAFLNRDFNFIRVNDAYAKSDARSPEDFIGKNHFELYPDEENERIFRHVVETGKAYRAWAKPYLYPSHPERGITYWDWALTPFTNDSSDLQFLVLSMDDVTQRTMAQENLRQANENLVRRTRQLQALTQQLSEAEDTERKRLSEILHDDLQQILTGARIRLAVLIRRVKSGKFLLDEFDLLEGLLDDAARMCRDMSHELVSPALAIHGIVPAIDSLTQQMKNKYGLEVRVDLDESVEVKEKSAAVFLYRALQELLFNVVKHSGVLSASVKFQKAGGHALLTVTDEGKGFDTAHIHTGVSEGFGLYSIRERVDLLGGALVLVSSQGKGTQVSVSIPINIIN